MIHYLLSIVIPAGISLSLACSSSVPPIPSYETMTTESDLVTIATLIARHESDTRVRSPRHVLNTDSIPPVTTESACHNVYAFKPHFSRADSTFTLVQFGQRDTIETKVVMGQAPDGASFDSRNGATFLMFLREHGDGRFEAVRPTDPHGSIEKLSRPWASCKPLDYDVMAAVADLVAIATPIARRELNHPATLPGRVFNTGDSIPAVEIETTFRSLVSLKSISYQRSPRFTLVHYRMRQSGLLVVVGQVPKLIDFAPRHKSVFLMFLRQRSDGRFEDVTPERPGDNIARLTWTADSTLQRSGRPANHVLQPAAPRDGHR